MAVARMKKLTVFCHRSLRDRVVATLERLQAMQILDARAALDGSIGNGLDLSAEESRLSARLDEVAYVIRYLQSSCPQQRGLLAGLLSFKDELTPEKLETARQDTTYRRVYQTCFGDEVRLNEIRARRQVLESRIQLLHPWTGLTMPIETVDDTSCTRVVALAVPMNEVDEFRSGTASFCHVSEASRDERTAWLLVICLLSDVDRLQEAISEANARAVQFGDLEGRPRDIVAAATAELAELTDQEAEIRARAMQIATDRLHLMAVHDHLANELQRVQLQSQFACTDQVDMILGWVKQRSVDHLTRELSDLGEVEVFVDDPGPDDNVPIELENHKLIKPFEVVTNLYGYPRYNEVDPTPLLAPFFFVFFGLALSDAGYGILLLVLGWLAIKKLGIPVGGQKLVKLLMLGGLSSLVLGAVTGSWFGDLFRLLPGFLSGLAAAASRITIVDPVSEPITVLLIALALGVIQVWTGILIKLVINLQAPKTRLKGIEQIGWLALIPGVILLGVGVGSELLAQILTYGGGGAVVLAGAINQPSWVLKPFSGLYNLYGIINYVGDILSYSRLLALGLATAVIGVVVNQIAQLVGAVPLIGAVLALAMIVGGHIFNLLVNTLGSFVHSGRLQFVEFFTKFFEGGGRPFRPFRWEGTYFTLTEPAATTDSSQAAQRAAN